ncbi:MAG: zinc ABC transporter substrate-binding protein [Bacteroidales bacterium]|nr:zinc ABC transporter substrate-binding protein [Bacteroidales bacterium]
MKTSTLYLFTGFIFSFALISGLTGCQQTSENKEKDIITVSILPYQYFVEKIAGNLFTCEVMIPPGASPASYEPTPRQVMNLSNSKLYLLSGYLAYEQNWVKNFKANLPNLEFYNTSQGLNLIKNEIKNHDDHDHGPIEPHVWTSPQNVKIISQNIADALIKIKPENKSIFLKNLEQFHKEIDSIDFTINQLLMAKTNRSFIIYHPALTYFAHDYKLTQIPIEQEGKEPSVKHIRAVADFAIENKIKVILIQKQFNKEEAKTLEQEIGGKIVEIDPLAFDWENEMIFIAKQLSENL